MLKEVTGSLRQYLEHRLSNPIYGAFLVSWATLNFRLLMVLWGAGTWREKIAYIDGRLYPKEWHWAWFGFGYPLLIATAFVIASPFVSRWVTVFLRQRERETLTRLLAIEDETPLTREEADYLRRSVLEERERRVKERDDANRRIDELQKQLDLAATNARANSESAAPVAPLIAGERLQGPADRVFALSASDFLGVPDHVSSKLVQRGLTQAQLEVLHVLRNGRTFSLEALQRQLRLPEHHAAKLLVDQLTALGLIELGVLPGGEPGNNITSAGTQALAAAVNRGFSAEA